MTNLAEFKNRKVVYQEHYRGRIIIVTATKANGFNPESYLMFICNEGFEILSDDSHNADNENEDIEPLVNTAKATIDRFLSRFLCKEFEAKAEHSCSKLSYYLNILLHLGKFAIAGMILYTWKVIDHE